MSTWGNNAEGNVHYDYASNFCKLSGRGLRSPVAKTIIARFGFAFDRVLRYRSEMIDWSKSGYKADIGQAKLSEMLFELQRVGLTVIAKGMDVGVSGAVTKRVQSLSIPCKIIMVVDAPDRGLRVRQVGRLVQFKGEGVYRAEFVNRDEDIELYAGEFTLG